jgi:hypothetical protein
MSGKCNDEQLRLQALKLRDPYDQPDLITAIPSDAKLFDIINECLGTHLCPLSSVGFAVRQE